VADVAATEALRVGALGLLIIALPARADPAVEADARTSVYQDTDATTISTTAVAARANPTDQWTIRGRYLADVVSSASVDVVSAATGRFHEVRHEGLASAGLHDGTTTALATGIYSVENDWRSYTGAGSFARDFVNHQLTLGLSGSLGFNEVGRAGDANFHRELWEGSTSLEATLVSSPKDLVNVAYSLLLARGYQASPYRHVRFAGPVPGITIAEPETDPDMRVRQALAVRYNRHLFSDSAIRCHLRGYIDDWGIKSGTGGLEYVIGLGDFELGIFARGYIQTHARFYREAYTERLRYMTADRELSSFADAFSGLRVGFAHRGEVRGFLDEIRAEIKGTGFVFDYFEFPRLGSRRGIIAELALGASF
jgi:hypothetical protein